MLLQSLKNMPLPEISGDCTNLALTNTFPCHSRSQVLNSKEWNGFCDKNKSCFAWMRQEWAGWPRTMGTEGIRTPPPQLLSLFRSGLVYYLMQLVYNKTKHIFIQQTPPLPAGASTLPPLRPPDSTSHPAAIQLYHTQSETLREEHGSSQWVLASLQIFTIRNT